ncbi:uncharacterized protein LOC144444859 [Glandiceps talaboti]
MKKIDIKYSKSSMREVEVLMNLPSHNHVVDIEGYFEDEHSINIVLELCKTDLNSFLTTENADDNRDLQFMVQLADAIQFLHGQDVIHRDLKLENVLVKYQGGVPIIKVTDFGLARFAELPYDLSAVMSSGDSLGVEYYFQTTAAMLEKKIINIGKNYLCALHYNGNLIGQVLYSNPNDIRQLDHSVNVAGDIRSLVDEMLLADHHYRPSAADVFHRL